MLIPPVLATSETAADWFWWVILAIAAGIVAIALIVLFFNARGALRGQRPSWIWIGLGLLSGPLLFLIGLSFTGIYLREAGNPNSYPDGYGRPSIVLLGIGLATIILGAATTGFTLWGAARHKAGIPEENPARRPE